MKSDLPVANFSKTPERSIKPQKVSPGLRCMGDPPGDENGGSVTKPVVAAREDRPMLLSRRESQVFELNG
jgi:hypothetical protein